MSHLFNTYFNKTNLMNSKLNQTNLIRIEPITLKQYPAAAKIMAYGFGHKFQKLFSVSTTDMAFVFEQLLLYSPHQTGSLRFVALENDVLVGTMALKWKGSEVIQKANNPRLNWWSMRSHIGCWKLLRIMAGIHLLKHEPEVGECYIEDITVDPHSQGKGVGRQLLAYAEQYMFQTAQLSYLSLHVARHNQKAVRMYERYHFRKQSSTNSLLTAMFLGENEWNYMTRRGDNNIETPHV
ncbi:GNAT family N-acetyltransferase [Paenibacillus amylolyticus]|jgi:ribosomal protein S18 acetylase RimI-like enzyme|uniref:GNAT family N-acetyltransferase n=2 Tax=Paenibacillus amylolyticus TaxID=1451 RepID=A0A5M9WZ21_PAEAM|nr:GNAT family N-acetyltransferase [Paenibacillus amylolyticus]